MKRNTIITVFIFLATSAFSQLKIIDNNNIGINTDAPLSKVSLGNNGYTYAYLNIFNNNNEQYSRGINVRTESTAFYKYAIVGSTLALSGDINIGIYGASSSSTALSGGKAYGIYGVAGNCTNGYNYGVYGRLYGTNNGAGVYGTITGDYGVSGRYAGFFYGDVKISGNAWINGSTVVTSDIRAKKDIRNIDKGSIQKIKELNGLKYKLKHPNEMERQKMMLSNVSDSIKTDVMSVEMEKVFNKERIGLSAQEVQVVYPELVVEGQDGTLGIDYIGLIPILIEAIKEQQIEIEALKTEVYKTARR